MMELVVYGGVVALLAVAGGLLYRQLRPSRIPDRERYLAVVDDGVDRRAHAKAFFDKTRGARLVVLSGPSGAGKSHFVQHGLLVDWRGEGTWPIVLDCMERTDATAMAQALLAALEAGSAVVREAGGTLDAALDAALTQGPLVVIFDQFDDALARMAPALVAADGSHKAPAAVEALHPLWACFARLCAAPAVRFTAVFVVRDDVLDRVDSFRFVESIDWSLPLFSTDELTRWQTTLKRCVERHERGWDALFDDLVADLSQRPGQSGVAVDGEARVMPVRLAAALRGVSKLDRIGPAALVRYDGADGLAALELAVHVTHAAAVAKLDLASLNRALARLVDPRWHKRRGLPLTEVVDPLDPDHAAAVEVAFHRLEMLAVTRRYEPADVGAPVLWSLRHDHQRHAVEALAARRGEALTLLGPRRRMALLWQRLRRRPRWVTLTTAVVVALVLYGAWWRPWSALLVDQSTRLFLSELHQPSAATMGVPPAAINRGANERGMIPSWRLVHLADAPLEVRLRVLAELTSSEAGLEFTGRDGWLRFDRADVAHALTRFDRAEVRAWRHAHLPSVVDERGGFDVALIAALDRTLGEQPSDPVEPPEPTRASAAPARAAPPSAHTVDALNRRVADWVASGSLGESLGSRCDRSDLPGERRPRSSDCLPPSPRFETDVIASLRQALAAKALGDRPRDAMAALRHLGPVSVSLARATRHVYIRRLYRIAYQDAYAEPMLAALAVMGPVDDPHDRRLLLAGLCLLAGRGPYASAQRDAEDLPSLDGADRDRLRAARQWGMMQIDNYDPRWSIEGSLDVMRAALTASYTTQADVEPLVALWHEPWMPSPWRTLIVERLAALLGRPLTLADVERLPAIRPSRAAAECTPSIGPAHAARPWIHSTPYSAAIGRAEVPAARVACAADEVPVGIEMVWGDTLRSLDLMCASRRFEPNSGADGRGGSEPPRRHQARKRSGGKHHLTGGTTRRVRLDTSADVALDEHHCHNRDEVVIGVAAELGPDGRITRLGIDCARVEYDGLALLGTLEGPYRVGPLDEYGGVAARCPPPLVVHAIEVIGRGTIEGLRVECGLLSSTRPLD